MSQESGAPVASETPEQKVAEDAKNVLPVVEGAVNQDVVAVETTKNALVNVGWRVEDVVEMVDHLWQHGVALVMHNQPKPPAA